MLHAIGFSLGIMHVHIPTEQSLMALRHASICVYEITWEQVFISSDRDIWEFNKNVSLCAISIKTWQ
jgi:hypothetical protein